MRIGHQFYKGSDSIASSVFRGSKAAIQRETLEEAIEDAKQAMRKDTSMDCAIVVQIVKVVLRDHPPLVVEDVEN